MNKKTCKKEGCNAYSWSKGYCQMHKHLAIPKVGQAKDLLADIEARAKAKFPKGMAGRSRINYVTYHSGEKVTSLRFEQLISAAKAEKLETFVSEHGYVFCEDCLKNTNAGEPIDCSHDISVKQCKEDPNICPSLAHDPENITFRCRSCHRKHDNM